MVLSARYVEYAAQGLTPKQVVALTGCRPKTAKIALTRAHEQLSANAAAAVALLERSSLARSVSESAGQTILSKRRWEDVALGLVSVKKLAA